MNQYTRPSTRAPGFALPIVMLLSMIGVIVVASMLTRYGSQNRFVNRHRTRYVEHHTQRGIQEMVGVWLDLASGGPIEEVIRDDGMAFTINFEGARRLEIFMHDGQGSLLVDFSAMNDRDRLICEAALQELQLGEFGTDFSQWTRRDGPLGVSVMTAPNEVLRAVLIGAEIDDSTAQRVADDIEQERERTQLSHQDLLRILGATGVSPESRGKAAAVLTATPSLWQIKTHVYDRRRGPMTARYSGLVEVRTGTSGRGNAQSSFKPAGPFLTWEVLDVN